MPKLLSNSNVTEITIIDPATLVEKQYLNDRKSFIMNNQKIENWEKINLAIDYYLKLGFWRNLENANSVVKFDEQVLNKVEELYNYATAFDVDWQKDTIQKCIDKA